MKQLKVNHENKLNFFDLNIQDFVVKAVYTNFILTLILL